VKDPTDTVPVHPDHETKKVGGIMYAFAMGVMAFLSLQVWLLNGTMGRLEERDANRKESLDRVQVEMRELRTELRTAVDDLRAEIRSLRPASGDK
jgi:signal transduction histidine kinase